MNTWIISALLIAGGVLACWGVAVLSTSHWARTERESLDGVGVALSCTRMRLRPSLGQHERMHGHEQLHT